MLTVRPVTPSGRRATGAGTPRPDRGELPGMSMYWIYDFPNWLLGVGMVAFFVGLSLFGLWTTRHLVRRLLDASPAHNDVVSWVFAGIGVFYGLALGLIAVA